MLCITYQVMEVHCWNNYYSRRGCDDIINEMRDAQRDGERYQDSL